MSSSATTETDGFPKADTLRNRTFVGLLIAQFLAAFNDQAIHAAAMFFAINKKALTEETAISLMPILFFAPWAIFSTLAGYYADKYSKRWSLVVWKFAEIGITALALLGFVLGSELNMPNTGVWIVLFTVFLMGTHSTFFVPAKYGAMPEILRDDLMSKGNGLLESLSFLATILGTVIGGVLSLYFHDDEYVIGLILLTLAVVGAGASLMIRRMKPANPGRTFPRYLYAPLVQNLQALWRSRPLRLVLVGIAFFTFMLAFMRAAVYMLGESKIPRWNELKTSGVVGMTALGIGLGSPMAGWLSGRKVELGLVPIGAVGMIVIICLAAIMLHVTPVLIVCIILIGFFTGFYLVPLFTQQQHRAPKHMKGEVIATCNFTNVIGAILASLLFFALVWAAHRLNLTPRFAQQDAYVDHALTSIEEDEHRHPLRVWISAAPGTQPIAVGKEGKKAMDIPLDLFTDDPDIKGAEVTVSQDAQVAYNAFDDAKKRGENPAPVQVTLSKYVVKDARAGDIPHFYARLVDEPLPTLYDNRNLPRLLFLGAGFMTLGVFLVLIAMLPDLLQRTRWVLRSLGKERLSVSGILHLPGDGPVVLATNASSPVEFGNVGSASDRRTHFVHAMTDLPKAVEWLEGGAVVVVPTDAAMLDRLRERVKTTFTILPTYSGPAIVKFGEPLPGTASADEILAGIDRAAKSSDH